MNARIPANTVPAALRELFTLILLNLREVVHLLRGPFLYLVLVGAWGAFLVLTGIADALGRMLPWFVWLALFMALLVITISGGLVRRPDTFPHEIAWERARVVFFAVSTVVLTTVYLASLFAFLNALQTPSSAA